MTEWRGGGGGEMVVGHSRYSNVGVALDWPKSYGYGRRFEEGEVIRLDGVKSTWDWMGVRLRNHSSVLLKGLLGHYLINSMKRSTYPIMIGAETTR